MPTILVEHHDASVRWAADRALQRAGFTVLTCPGPGGLSYRQCPLLAGEGCELVAKADHVMNGLAGDEGLAVVAAERTLMGDDRLTRLDPMITARAVAGNPTRPRLLAALDRILRRHA